MASLFRRVCAALCGGAKPRMASLFRRVCAALCGGAKPRTASLFRRVCAAFVLERGTVLERALRRTSRAALCGATAGHGPSRPRVVRAGHTRHCVERGTRSEKSAWSGRCAGRAARLVLAERVGLAAGLLAHRACGGTGSGRMLGSFPPGSLWAVAKGKEPNVSPQNDPRPQAAFYRLALAVAIA